MPWEGPGGALGGCQITVTCAWGALGGHWEKLVVPVQAPSGGGGAAVSDGEPSQKRPKFTEPDFDGMDEDKLREGLSAVGFVGALPSEVEELRAMAKKAFSGAKAWSPYYLLDYHVCATMVFVG